MGVRLAAAQSGPPTLVLDGELLAAKRKVYTANSDARVAAAVREIVKRSDRVVAADRTYSVTKKPITPPSGDKHDYMSQAPYWWPDPSKPNGLPYIRRDGERNPELKKISDHDELDGMLDDAEALSLAYFFTRDGKYSKQSSAVLRAWFLDPRTRQNPNLNFAQGIPGISTGRGIGMIETRNMHRAIDAAILIGGSEQWSDTDHAGLKKWFSEFLDWAKNSPLGKDESDERNNHGTYYDVQVVSYAIFTGRSDVARKQLEVSKSRIASQIEPDGRQPHELARTLSWGYANMNLLGFFMLARLGESAGVDLWNYKTPDGRGLKRAIDWLAPFASGEKQWEHKQIKPRTFELTVPLLRIGAAKYKNAGYAAVAEKLAKDNTTAVAAIGLY